MTAKKNGIYFGIAALAAMTFTGGVAVAGPLKVANVTKDGKPVCPITKEAFTVTAASERSTYKGKTYAFCCEGCKPQFDKNPAKYVQTAANKTSVKRAKPGAMPAVKGNAGAKG